MARTTGLILIAAALLSACATPEQAPVGGTTSPGVEPRAQSPSGAPLGRDNPTSTYQQPAVGPERRLEPPPLPRRP